MDELFLQILKANEEAQEELDRAYGASSSLQKDLQTLKNEVDESVMNWYENQAQILLDSRKKALDSLKEDSKEIFLKEKAEVESVFKEKSKAFHKELLERITKDHVQ